MLQPKYFGAKNSREHREHRGMQGKATPLAHMTVKQRGMLEGSKERG